MNPTKSILRQTAIYGVGQALRGLSSLILLPIYTHFLTPADYGLIELLTVVVDLTALVLGLRIGAGIFKYYTDAENSIEKCKVISSALGLLTIAGVFGIACLYLLSDTLTAWLAAPAGFAPALQVLSLTLVVSAINETFFAYLRIEDRPTLYVVLNLFKVTVQFILNIAFIVYADLGYWGIIWASLLSGLLLAIYFCTRLWPSIGLGVSKHYATKLLRFSIPIVVSSLLMFYITFGNRFLLKAYAGLEAVGIYALAYKLGLTFFSLIWSPFAIFWNAKQFEFAAKPESRILFGHIFFYANLVLIPSAVGVVVLAPHFLRLLTAQDFWGAITVVPWVVGASVLLSWTDFFRFGLLHAEKTSHIGYGTLVTALLVTILYLVWIPAGGSVGAAQAVFVAFAFRLTYVFVVGQHYFRIVIPWWRLVAVLVYFVTLGVLLASWSTADTYALFAKTLTLIIGGCLLVFTPAILKEHRRAIFAGITRALSNTS